MYVSMYCTMQTHGPPIAVRFINRNKPQTCRYNVSRDNQLECIQTKGTTR